MLPASEPQNPALLDEAKLLWLELIGLVGDRLELAALETQHAGRSLVAMVATGAMVALLVISAWLGLLSAAVVWLVSSGLNTSLAILLGVVVNLLLAAILYRSIRHQSRHLGWPATLRSLHPSASVKGNDHVGP